VSGFQGNGNPYPVQLYPVEYTPDGEQAIIDYSDIPSELPAVPGAPAGARQFEVFNATLAAAGTARFEASWRPEHWLVYLVTNTSTDQARVSQGADPVQPALYLQMGAVITLPGLHRQLAVYGATVTGTITVVAVAYSNCDLSVGS